MTPILVRLALVVGLWAIAGLGVVAQSPRPASDIEIVEAPTANANAGVQFMRPFNTLTSPECSARKPALAVLELWGAEAKRIVVVRRAETWPDMKSVTEYLRRLLTGVPEGGQLFPHIYWSEGPRVEIVGFVEFANGGKGQLEFGNGYAHVQDASGCEWWARYLGGNRTKWIVRP